MKILNSKTPLLAAFFLATTLIGCRQDNTTPPAENTAAIQTCASSTTPIAAIQGTGPTSDMVGDRVTVQGVVTLIEPGTGLYIEEPDSDDNERSSNAIFVESTNSQQPVQMGSLIYVEGSVAEISKGRESLTALVDTGEFMVCDNQLELPLTISRLPMGGLDREAIEAMRVSFPGSLTITDNYNAGKGLFGVSSNGIQYTATELMSPGPKANDLSREHQSFVLPLQLDPGTFDSPTYELGTSINDVVGIMTHDDRALRLKVTSSSNPGSDSAPTSFDLPPTMPPNATRVASMNLFNYFNGDGLGGDFPTPRGAKSIEEFDQQRQRIGAALKALQPQLLAVMELENDGFGPNSATADLIALLEQHTQGSWATARPENDNTGNDAIKVALFYRSDLWQPKGSARTISGPEFRKSRQPLAQVLSPMGGGESILLVVNHFKSKGSCPDSGPDANQNDGQGCWSPTRTRTAKLMTSWVNSLAATSQTSNILIMGDMNSYRREAPIDAIRDAGFEELLDSDDSRPFSYVYYGQVGTLDYAFVNPELKPKVQNAFIWQVNSTMPNHFDLPKPWLRFSDHDPVVVDLLLRH